jgi:hypothetical protein
MKNTFYEFFAGGGMAHAGLGSSWDCLLANDMFNSARMLSRRAQPGLAPSCRHQGIQPPACVNESELGVVEPTNANNATENAGRHH